MSSWKWSSLLPQALLHTREGSMPASCLLWADPPFGSSFQTENYHQCNSGSSLLRRHGGHHHDAQRDWFLGCSQTPRYLTNTYRVCTKVRVTCPVVTLICTSIWTGWKMSSPSPGWWDMRQISMEVPDTVLYEQLGRLAAILQADKLRYLLYRSKPMPNICQEWPQQHQTLKI